MLRRLRLALGVGAALAAAPALGAGAARAAAPAPQAELVATEARAAATARAVARLTSRIAATEWSAQAAASRLALIDAQLRAGNALLAREQAALAPMLAAIESLARRPVPVLLLHPAPLTDAARIGLALDAALPGIRARTDRLRRALHRAERLRMRAEAERRALAVTRAELDRDLRALTRLGSQLARRAATLRELLDAVSAPMPAAPRLGLLRPSPGRLITRFGDPNRVGLPASGVTWRTGPNAGVVAPAAGRIAFAGPFRTYGRIVIIEHGGGVLTLLAGLGDIAVKPGQAVRAGEPLGRAGAARAVYFELRSGGGAVDPLPWITSPAPPR